MAQDIIPREDEELTCPHCNKKVLLKSQLAVYGDGGDSIQILGLEKRKETNVMPKNKMRTLQ